VFQFLLLLLHYIWSVTTLTFYRSSIKLVEHELLSVTKAKMLFRMSDGEIAEVNKQDYATEQEYVLALHDVYEVRQQVQTQCAEGTDQTEFIYNLMMGFAPSRL
jgi:hypothetical protein